MTAAFQAEALWPDFLLVGAARAGTTALYRYLLQHPDIFMPAIKEPHYLVASRLGSLIDGVTASREAYLDLFAPGRDAIRRGEASVLYLYYYREAIAAMRANIGEPRILIMLRDPVERALSAYLYMARYNRDEDAPTFADALAREPERLAANRVNPLMHYRAMSRYGEAVAAYQAAFSRVYVILYEDFRARPRETLRGVFRFLDVAPEVMIDVARRYNEGGWVWSSPRLKAAVNEPGPVRRLTGMVRHHAPALYRRLRAAARALGSHRPAMDAAACEALRRELAPDVDRLACILHRDLSMWKGGVTKGAPA